MELVIPPVAPEVIFHIGSFGITNSMINGWIAVVFFVFLSAFIEGKNSMIPKGFQNIVEFFIETILNEIKKVTGDEKRARMFFPLVSTIFIYLLFSNWLGLLPGTGSIGVWGIHNGEKALLPLLRPVGSDLNVTIGIAIVAVIMSHVYGIRAVGGWNYFNKFFKIKDLFTSFKKGPMAVGVAVIEFGVGLIEIVSEFAKVASLSLRLFGNIFAGEVLMTVMLALFSFFLPIPFMMLELLVGLVQATVFSMLTLAYLTVATTPLHPEAHH